MGRAPLNRLERQLNGNARRTPLPKANGHARSAVNLVCPDWVSQEAKDFWQRMVPQLIRDKVVDDRDWPALVNMCQAWAEFQVATKVIEAEGRIYEMNGAKCMHPAVKMQMAALKTVNSFMEKFGLQPTTRARLPVSVDASLEDGDTYSEFLEE